MDDRHQIIEALARFAAGLDRKDWDVLREILLPDAFAYGSRGREEAVATVRRHLGGCGPTQHLLGNHRVEVDGDRARSLTYARVYHQGAGEREGDFYECFGEYEDHWTRTAQGWRLARRRFEITMQLGDFSVLQPG